MLLDAVEKNMRKEYTLEGVYQVRNQPHIHLYCQCDVHEPPFALWEHCSLHGGC